jgi:hypothetical protein
LTRIVNLGAKRLAQLPDQMTLIAPVNLAFLHATGSRLAFKAPEGGPPGCREAVPPGTASKNPAGNCDCLPGPGSIEFLPAGLLRDYSLRLAR